MIAVVQRVSSAEVRLAAPRSSAPEERGSAAGERVAAIGRGLLVLLAAAKGDGEADADWLAGKLAVLRIFDDGEGRLNLGVLDVGGSVLLVSNFTVCGDAAKGRRPSFDRAAPFEDGRRLFERCLEALRAQGVPVEAGAYGETMSVSLVNDGPVTLVLESPGAM